MKANNVYRDLMLLMAGVLSLVVMGSFAFFIEWPSTATVRMRVENSSELDFDVFLVNFPGQVESYGPLAAGAVSEFRDVEASWGYAETEARSGERQYLIQPIDGEQHLSPGAYTLRYTIEDGRLFSQLIVVARDKDWRRPTAFKVR